MSCGVCESVGTREINDPNALTEQLTGDLCASPWWCREQCKFSAVIGGRQRRVTVSDACLAVPLRCGPPLSYLDWDMLFQLGAGVVESGIAFGAAAYAVDYGAERGWLQRFK